MATSLYDEQTKPHDEEVDELASLFELALGLNSSAQVKTVGGVPLADGQKSQPRCKAQRKVQRSIGQTTKPCFESLTESTLKRCANLRKLIANKESLLKSLKQILPNNHKSVKRNRDEIEADKTCTTKRGRQQLESFSNKRKRDSDSKEQIMEEYSRFLKLRKYNLAQNKTVTTMVSPSPCQTEIENPSNQEHLETSTFKQPEPSLEEFLKDYEDFWQVDSTNYTTIFEDDHLYCNEEQQVNYEEYDDFLEVLDQYEEQFNNDCLSLREEKDVLELLYDDLEAKGEEIRENNKKGQSQKIKALEAEIDDLHVLLSLYINGASV